MKVNNKNFPAYCNRLGITPPVLAKKFNVARSTAKRWLDRDIPLKDEQLNWVEFRLNEFNRIVDETINFISKKRAQKHSIALIYYLPTTFEKWGDSSFEFAEIHHAIISDICTHCDNAFMIRFNKKKYLDFLQDRKDSQSERATWAACEFIESK